MDKLLREDIHIVSLNSNLSKEELEVVLCDNVYPDNAAWLKMIRLFLISVGIGFTVAGVVFFFAYNWDDLSKFSKLGLTQGLIVASTTLVLIPKIDLQIRKIILTGSSILVGVLFAVFGQIYQTGANAYDFFLAWTICITLWVIISDFAALWLIYIGLINVTFILYAQQVAKYWTFDFVFFVLFLTYSIVHIAAVYANLRKSDSKFPSWFTNILALAAISYATNSYLITLDNHKARFELVVLFAPALYALAIWYALKSKTIFYIASIALSVIVCLSSTILVNVDYSESVFLFLSVFIVASVTLIIRFLIHLQKKWTNEKV